MCQNNTTSVKRWFSAFLLSRCTCNKGLLWLIPAGCVSLIALVFVPHHLSAMLLPVGSWRAHHACTTSGLSHWKTYLLKAHTQASEAPPGFKLGVGMALLSLSCPGWKLMAYAWDDRSHSIVTSLTLQRQSRNNSIDRWNRAIVIADLLAEIRITSIRWRSYLPQPEIGPHRPCVRCAAVRIARLAFIRATLVPRELRNGLQECWMLVIGGWRFCPSKNNSFRWLLLVAQITILCTRRVNHFPPIWRAVVMPCLRQQCLRWSLLWRAPMISTQLLLLNQCVKCVPGRASSHQCRISTVPRQDLRLRCWGCACVLFLWCCAKSSCKSGSPAAALI